MDRMMRGTSTEDYAIFQAAVLTDHFITQVREEEVLVQWDEDLWEQQKT